MFYQSAKIKILVILSIEQSRNKNHMTIRGNDQWPTQFLNCTSVPLSSYHSDITLHLILYIRFQSWTPGSIIPSCSCTNNFRLICFRTDVKSTPPDSLALCSLSLHCVVIDRETSSDFMPDCLCLCQVQVGSGCRRLAIIATAMKANAVSDWLNCDCASVSRDARLVFFSIGDVQQFSWCSSVDAIYIKQHMCQGIMTGSGLTTVSVARASTVTETRLHTQVSSHSWRLR